MVFLISQKFPAIRHPAHLPFHLREVFRHYAGLSFPHFYLILWPICRDVVLCEWLGRPNKSEPRETLDNKPCHRLFYWITHSDVESVDLFRSLYFVSVDGSAINTCWQVHWAMLLLNVFNLLREPPTLFVEQQQLPWFCGIKFWFILGH